MREHAALLLSSGSGPAECRIAVGHLLRHLEGLAHGQGLETDAVPRAAPDGPKSVVLQLSGPGAEVFAADWEGVALWRATSPLRPQHKRKNWFVEVFRLDPPRCAPQIDPAQVVISTLRAGGPGGQHQNTTDSAVRAVWQAPEGHTYAVTVRSDRSQHQNRRLALARLQSLVALEQAEAAAAAKGQSHKMHQSLQRGAPRHRFVGPGFEPGG